jgi:hypothetical protein
VSAEGSAAPRVLGTATGYESPAVAYAEGDGVRPGAYFVVWTADDGVHLVRIVEPTDAPRPYRGADRPIPSFGATEEIAVFPASEAAGASLVQHAFRTADGVATLLGLSWREGCLPRTAVGTVAAAAVVIDASGAVRELPRVTVQANEVAPSIAWTPRADGAAPGALIVAFTDPGGGRVRGSRVDVNLAAGTLTPSAPEILYERLNADVRAAVVRTGLTGAATLDEAPYLLVADEGRPLLGGPLQCVPSPPGG